MLKTVGKIAIVASALSLTTMALAGGPDTMAMPSTPAAAPSGTGFFLGLEGGMGMLDAKDTTNLTAVIAGHGTDTVSSSTLLASNSFLGGLVGGYQKVFSNSLYLGLAGNVLYNSLNDTVASSTLNSTTHNFKVKNDFQGGADVRLGKRFDDVIPYVLGGFEAGSWRYALNNVYTKSTTLVGPKAGVGVLISLPSSNWQAGLEYAYTWFGDINRSGTNSGATTSASSKLNVNQGQIMASASYLFS